MKEPRPTNWKVNLRGRVDEYVVRALEAIQSSLTTLQQQVELIKRSMSGPVSIELVRSALQAGGAAPLNVEGLLGLLGTPQTGGAPSRAANPDLNDPFVKDGALFVLTGAPNALYRVNGSHVPATFDSIGGSGSVTSVATNASLSGGPITTSGTLSLVLGTTDVLQKSNGTQLIDSSITDDGTDVTIEASTLIKLGLGAHILFTVDNGTRLVLLGLTDLPTADPAVPGALWRDGSNFIKISP